nr:hypothetical protein Iba_chr14eCG7120 [Ipomoea batatas]
MQNHKWVSLLQESQSVQRKEVCTATASVGGNTANQRDQSLSGLSEVQVGVDNSAAGLHTVFDIPVDIPIESVESESYVMAEEILVQTGPEAALGDEASRYKEEVQDKICSEFDIQVSWQ